MQPTQQDIRTLHGVITAIAEGRKGPGARRRARRRRGGVLRTLLAEHGQGRVPNERGAGARAGAAACAAIRPTPSACSGMRSCSDRRFAGLGFKRQVPVGPHITDLVSFPLRWSIDLVPADESEAAAKARARAAGMAHRARLSRPHVGPRMKRNSRGTLTFCAEHRADSQRGFASLGRPQYDGEDEDVHAGQDDLAAINPTGHSRASAASRAQIDPNMRITSRSRRPRARQVRHDLPGRHVADRAGTGGSQPLRRSSLRIRADDAAIVVTMATDAAGWRRPPRPPTPRGLRSGSSKFALCATTSAAARRLERVTSTSAGRGAERKAAVVNGAL